MNSISKVGAGSTPATGGHRRGVEAAPTFTHSSFRTSRRVAYVAGGGCFRLKFLAHLNSGSATNEETINPASTR